MKTEFMKLYENLNTLTEETVSAADANIIDYVEYKHSYCHLLEPKLKKINYYCNVLKKPIAYIKAMIRNILNDPECRWTDKEKLFMDNVYQHVDNYELYKYVKNSIDKGHRTGVYVDDNGELIPELNKEYVELEMAESLTESRSAADIEAEIEKLKAELAVAKVAERKATYSEMPSQVYIGDMYLDPADKGTGMSAELYNGEYDGVVFETEEEALSAAGYHLQELEDEGELSDGDDDSVDPDDYTIEAIAIPLSEVSEDTLYNSNLEHLI